MPAVGKTEKVHKELLAEKQEKVTQEWKKRKAEREQDLSWGAGRGGGREKSYGQRFRGLGFWVGSFSYQDAGFLGAILQPCVPARASLSIKSQTNSGIARPKDLGVLPGCQKEEFSGKSRKGLRV